MVITNQRGVEFMGWHAMLLNWTKSAEKNVSNTQDCMLISYYLYKKIVFTEEFAGSNLMYFLFVLLNSGQNSVFNFKESIFLNIIEITQDLDRLFCNILIYLLKKLVLK